MGCVELMFRSPLPPKPHLMSPGPNVLIGSDEAVLERFWHHVVHGGVRHGEQRDDVSQQPLVVTLSELGVRLLEGLKVRPKELERLRHARHRTADEWMCVWGDERMGEMLPIVVSESGGEGLLSSYVASGRKGRSGAATRDLGGEGALFEKNGKKERASKTGALTMSRF